MIKQYVGARYVPKFASPVEWAADTSYEALTIVTFNNASYTSKVPVPPTVGNPANNPQYWALTGNYNAQVEEYRQAVENIKPNKMFNTATDLINSDAKIGDKCLTLGYSSVNDGGWGIYAITNSIPNSYYETLTNGLYAVLCNANNVKQFGCTGNGSTNDTANFQKAINALTNIIIPSGTYILDGLTVDGTHNFIGENSTLKFNNLNNEYGLKCFSPDVTFKNLTIIGQVAYTDNTEDVAANIDKESLGGSIIRLGSVTAPTGKKAIFENCHFIRQNLNPKYTIRQNGHFIQVMNFDELIINNCSIEYLNQFVRGSSYKYGVPTGRYPVNIKKIIVTNNTVKQASTGTATYLNGEFFEVDQTPRGLLSDNGDNDIVIFKNNTINIGSTNDRVAIGIGFIKNFNVSNNIIKAPNGFDCDNPSNGIVENNKFINTKLGIRMGGDGDYYSTIYNENVHVINNEFINTIGEDIVASDGKNCKYNNNIITKTSGIAIHNYNCKKCEITGNSITGGNEFLYMETCNDIDIHHNNVNIKSLGSFLGASHNIEIHDNNFAGLTSPIYGQSSIEALPDVYNNEGVNDQLDNLALIEALYVTSKFNVYNNKFKLNLTAGGQTLKSEMDVHNYTVSIEDSLLATQPNLYAPLPVKQYIINYEGPASFFLADGCLDYPYIMEVINASPTQNRINIPGTNVLLDANSKITVLVHNGTSTQIN